jgi:Rrf2 family protein
MADIAGHTQEKRPVPLRDVAQRQQISRLYLSQLTILLRNAALLKSVWGNKGGYLLARAPEEIRLLDIVEAVDGPFGVMDCVLDPNLCSRAESCECIGVWCSVSKSIARTLSSYTLKDVLARKPASRRTGGGV